MVTGLDTVHFSKVAGIPSFSSPHGVPLPDRPLGFSTPLGAFVQAGELRTLKLDVVSSWVHGFAKTAVLEPQAESLRRLEKCLPHFPNLEKVVLLVHNAWFYPIPRLYMLVNHPDFAPASREYRVRRDESRGKIRLMRVRRRGGTNVDADG